MSRNRVAGGCAWLAGVLSLALCAGCALTPPRPVVQLSSDKGLREVAEFLDAQARQCWAREASILKNGVLIDSRRTIQDSVRIAAVRYGRQIGVQKAFVIVEIVPVASGVQIEVAEGEYECEIGLGCYEMKFAQDVPRWLSGDRSCAAKSAAAASQPRAALLGHEALPGQPLTAWRLRAPPKPSAA